MPVVGGSDTGKAKAGNQQASILSLLPVTSGAWYKLHTLLLEAVMPVVGGSDTGKAKAQRTRPSSVSLLFARLHPSGVSEQ
jgi:hypothetical protein